MPISNGGGGGSSPVRQATVTLTDGQIKALPSTPVEIVAAPGVGQFLVPLGAWLIIDATAGAYTNFNAPSGTNPYASSVYLAWDALNFFNDALGPAQATGLLSHAERRVTYLSPVSGNMQEVGGDLADSSGLVYGDPAIAALGYDNASLSVVGQNNALGDFTGGNPANTLKVSLFYAVAE